METMEYKNSFKGTSKRSIVAYTLGLIGSTLSLTVCFVTGVIMFSIGNLISRGISIVSTLPKIIESEFLLNIVAQLEKFASDSMNLVSVYWIVMVIGFISGIVGTISCWINNSVVSSFIMIVGGVFSIFCILFPGVFLLIGGIINLKNVVRSAKIEKTY